MLIELSGISGYFNKIFLILAMDDSNIEDIQSLVGMDTEHKIHRLLDFTDHPRNIRDPWYTGNFDESYWDIYEGCQAFLEYLKLNNLLG